MARDKKKKKKEKHVLSKGEFAFNFLSLVAIIGVGIYFGYRSLYYYSKQNMKIKEEAQTLNGLIIQNNPVAKKDEVGLHQDTEGYYFKGKVENNYVKFFNQVYRVIRINDDNSVRMINEDINASFMWGEDSHYKGSNIWKFLNKVKDNNNSGIYLDTIPNYEKYLKKTKYSEDKLLSGKVESSDKILKDYGTLLTIKDYTSANGKESYLNNGKIFNLVGFNEDKENLYIEEDGSVQAGDNLEGFGIRVVITLKENTTVVGGAGTKEDPYVINTGEDKTYINSYVKLGNDMWRVYQDGDSLKLNLDGYIKVGDNEVIRNYSLTNSVFNLSDKKNIAYYLNTDYLNSLSYNGILLDTNYNIGEISDDAGYSIDNIYNKTVTSKVGLLNIFDFISNSELENYFFINTTSEVGSMQYDRFKNGLLEESDVRDVKHIVPTICIDKKSIKSGTGTADDPYTVE